MMLRCEHVRRAYGRGDFVLFSSFSSFLQEGLARWRRRCEGSDVVKEACSFLLVRLYIM
jgi:hypothetical protein